MKRSKNGRTRTTTRKLTPKQVKKLSLYKWILDFDELAAFPNIYIPELGIKRYWKAVHRTLITEKPWMSKK